MKTGTASQWSPEPEGNGYCGFAVEAAPAECRMNAGSPAGDPRGPFARSDQRYCRIELFEFLGGAKCLMRIRGIRTPGVGLLATPYCCADASVQPETVVPWTLRQMSPWFHASVSRGQRRKHGGRRRREVVAGRFRYRWQVTAIEAGSWPRSVARHFHEVVRATLLIVLICGAVTLLSAGRLNAQVFDVTNGNSSGPGSLAQAVSDANASGAAAIIRIDVPAVSLAREVEPLNAMLWTTTVGSSQITLPLSSGYSDIVSFGPNALQ
jgi:hypothetical protein